MPILDTFERFTPLDDIDIRAEGGKRIIDAYAALFDVRQEVTDRHGHYMEHIAAGAFAKTLIQRGDRLQAIFNHGMTIHGTPAERFSMPYGKILDIHEDGRGLFTSVQVAPTDLGDEILQLVDSGIVRGQSFGGAFVKSSTAAGDKRSGLKEVARTEIAMREFGLSPFPTYDTGLVGVRADIDTMNVDELEEFVRSHPEVGELVARLTATPDTGTGEGNAPDTGTRASHMTQGERNAVLRRLALEATTS